MDNLEISDTILRKLRERHHVDRREVEQCFENRLGRLLEDKRTRHRTRPPTLWFLSKTNKGRVLKIVYIQTGTSVALKSAFAPNADELSIYANHGGVAY
ncbi:MAG: ADP-ribosyl-(dinitrogen reductase) hydrolase [Burkholderiales bacterium]|nr:ADP-ribosyl-(dinitrogen reductase) hydrolase [Burkholderiales bacterium]